MKKLFSFMAIALCCAMTFTSCSSDDDNSTAVVLKPATFDELTLEEENSVKQYASGTGFADFISGGYTFQNYCSNDSYWSCFTLTNKTTTTGIDSDNPYESAIGGAKSGKNYVVWNSNYYGQDKVTLNSPATVSGFYVSNTTYAVHSFVIGDSYARGLRNNGDNFVLMITGYKADDTATGTVTYTMAEVKDGKINYVKAWRWVDLTSLGEVSYVKFEMDGTDKSYGYLNTAAYFAMDDFGGVAPSQDVAYATVDIPQ